MIQLVIADDHRIILEGLEQLFRRERDFQVVTTCTTGEQAIEAVRRFQPDVAVLDVQMPQGGGLAVLNAIRTENLSTKVVLLTAMLEDEQAVRAIDLGVHGIVLKESAAVKLVDCVRRVYHGARVLDQTVVNRAVNRMMERKDAVALAQTLSPRETEIVRMIASGLRNKEIALKLSIGEGTVKTHLHTIYRKLGVEGRVELALYAVEHGIAASDSNFR